jgi:F0F1-type ATP synthase membrane subunit b/b'
VSVQFLSTFAAEESTGLASLGIDPKALLLQAGTFLILYLLFKKFAMAKVVKTLADESKRLTKVLANADH